MKEDKIKKLMRPLNFLKENVDSLESAAIINSLDGLVIASTCASEAEEQNIAAIVSSVCSNTLNMASNLDKGNLKQLLLDTEKGYILVVIINDSILLAVLANTETNLGLLFLNVKKALKKILDLL